MLNHKSPLRPAAAALAMAFALAASAPSTQAQDLPIDPAKAARLNALTNQLIAGIGEFHRASASQRAAAATKLKTAARERRTLLLSTLESQPGLTLRRALPAGLTAGLPADVLELLEREVKVSGRITNVHRDDMATGTCSDRYFVELADAPVPLPLRLHAADAPDRPGKAHPAANFVGQNVTVRAMRLDNQLLVADAGAFEAAGDASVGTSSTTITSAAISGTQNTLVLMGNFQDKAMTCTVAGVHNLVFGASNSVHDLYRESSNNALTFAGTTYGPFTIPQSSTTCDYGIWGSELDKLATAQGIDISRYPRKLYVLPPNACSFAGVANVGGTSTGAWVFHCGATDLYAHELGHNLSFRHASTPSSTYGDNSDVMGISGMALRQLNAPNKVRAGWIPSSHVRQVSGSGVFTLSPTAAVSPLNPQALVLPKPDTSDSYTISLRQGVGYDNNLGSAYKNRVSVHRSTSTGSTTFLLATLGAGESYSDAVNGYQFTVNGIGADSATVSVSVSAAQCVRAAPAVSITPISQSGAPGKPINYSVTVTSNNNAGCGTSTYAFTPQVPAGWTSAASPATLALANGGAGTAVWTVTSPTSGTSEQSYPVALTAYDTAAPSSAQQAQANYIVTAPDSTPPTVAVTSPTNGSTVSGTVAITATAADNIGVAKVEFWVNGALAGTDTAAPYSFNLNTRKMSGALAISARAFDAAGNSATSPSLSVTVGASGGKGGPKR